MKREHKVQSRILPSGYRQLEYIESTGTQYIDTGISAPNGFNATVVLQINEHSGYDYPRIIGSHNTSSPYGRNGCCARWMNGFQLSYGNGYPVWTTTILPNTDYTIEVQTFLRNAYLKVNGTTVLSNSSIQTLSANDIWIFYDLYCKNVSKKGTFKAILKAATLTNNNVTMNLIPALRLSDNKPGLYDLNGNICPLTSTPFFINAGTSEFLYA